MKTQRLEKTFGILIALLLAIVLVACSTPEPTVDEGAGETATSVPADPTTAPADPTTAPADPTITPAVDTIENQLIGTNWELDSMNGVDVDDDMTLSFGSGTISGSDGCNTFNGEYTIENGVLMIGDNIASTLMACADVDAEMSQQYLNALVTAGEFTLNGDDLTIQTENGALVFERDDDTTPAVDTIENQLIGTNWELESVDGVEAGDDMTLSFGSGTISGSDGCNTFSGGYTIENGMLVIADNLAMTAMACADVDAEMSQQYMNALVTSGEFTLDGDDLTIQTENGALVFERHDDTTPAVDTIENQLIGTNWELESVNGVEAGDDMTLSFGSGTISGSDGCNTFNGEYTIEKGMLVIADNLAMTAMACADVDAEMSQQYMNALVTAGEFTLNGDDLTIQTENGALVFERDDDTTPAVDTIENQLIGTNWELESVNGVEAGDDMTLSFGSGTISGSDGCNTFNGEYTIENGMLVIADNLAMTAMACADVDAEMSQQYMNALVTSGEFTLDGDDLTIQTENGALVFERDDMDGNLMDSVVWCQFAGTGGTVAIDGERANFTCLPQQDEPIVALLGDIRIGDDGWMITRAVLSSTDDGFVADSTESVVVSYIELVDGTQCADAGRGATIVLNGKRANFTCGDAEENIVLLGDVEIGDEGWMIEQATFVHGDDGFSAESSELVQIAALGTESLDK